MYFIVLHFIVGLVSSAVSRPCLTSSLLLLLSVAQADQPGPKVQCYFTIMKCKLSVIKYQARLPQLPKRRYKTKLITTENKSSYHQSDAETRHLKQSRKDQNDKCVKCQSMPKKHKTRICIEGKTVYKCNLCNTQWLWFSGTIICHKICRQYVK